MQDFAPQIGAKVTLPGPQCAIGQTPDVDVVRNVLEYLSTIDPHRFVLGFGCLSYDTLDRPSKDGAAAAPFAI